MKKLFMGLLVFSLIIAIGSPALAVDVKVTGKAEVLGYWENNRAMADSGEVATRFYSTFVRIEPVFKVSDSLSVVTRFDGLERVAGLTAIGNETTCGRNTANEQNIAVRRGFISAKIMGGTFDVGYMGGGQTGTQFLDYDADVFRVKFVYVNGPLIIQAYTEKAKESSLTLNNGPASDADKDKYTLTPIYKWNGGEFGTQLQWYRYNDTEIVTTANPKSYKGDYYLVSTWFKTQIGNTYVEGEIQYYFGKAREYSDGVTPDRDYKSFNWYIMAKQNMGPGYIGAQVARVQGQDSSTDVTAPPAPASECNIIYQPTLVLWNDWANRWTNLGFGKGYAIIPGALGAGTNVPAAGVVNNVKLYQIMGGYKVLPNLSLDAAFTMAWADEQGACVSDKYGNEFDIKATYKIFDNLNYVLGFGYLWAGDYFKGTDTTAVVGNDWLLLHKLTLNF
jgi:hypothetical protein